MPGVGDEVVLFVAFIVLSVVLIGAFSLWKRRNGQRPSSAQRPAGKVVASVGERGESRDYNGVLICAWVLAEVQANVGSESRNEEDVSEQAGTVRGGGGGREDESLPSQLRHRTASQPQSEGRERDEREGGGNDIRVRLVSLNTTREITVPVTSTLNDLRR